MAFSSYNRSQESQKGIVFMQDTQTKESNFQKLRRELASMSFEDKIDHIWTYYKINLFLLVLIPAILIPLVTNLFRKEPDMLLYGNFCNVAVTEDGQRYLTADYLQALGVSTEEYTAEIELSSTAGMGMSSANSQGVDGGITVVAEVAANMLDYIVCDEIAVEFLSAQQSFLPLDQVLTPEQLDAYAPRIYTYTDEEFGDRYSFALDVTDLPFFRDNAGVTGKCYFAFANKKNADPLALQELLSYLENWKALE